MAHSSSRAEAWVCPVLTACTKPYSHGKLDGRLEKPPPGTGSTEADVGGRGREVYRRVKIPLPYKAVIHPQD